MWDIRTNKEAAIFKPKNGAVRDVQFSPLVKFKSVAPPCSDVIAVFLCQILFLMFPLMLPLLSMFVGVCC